MIRTIFDGVFDFLERTLDLRGLRQRLIASNIANEETPNYKAMDVNFQAELERRMGGRLQVVTTREGHMEGGGFFHGPDVIVSLSPAGLDGNSVSLEKEMVKLAENAIMYNATARIISKRFQILREAIKEGR